MPEQTMTAPCGLVTKGGAVVALTGVTVEAEVRALCAAVTVTQRYRNDERHPIEAVYLFPLDEGAAVCGFEVVIDGRRVVGVVKDRDEAFRLYDDAMSEGHGAYLLDEERPDVFQASVGNLLPGAEVQLTLTYVVELDAVEDGVRFVVPATVAPRYAPAEDHTGIGRSDAVTLNPPRALEVPYGIDLRVRLATPRRPSRIGSPSHAIDVEWIGDASVVTLSHRGTPLDRDFVLVVEGAGFDVPTTWTELGPDGDRAVAVAFVPRFTGAPRNTEVVFIVDRSGSMAGASIKEVRNALQLCLRSLTPGCRFNIVGFGTSVERLFPESRVYDDESLTVAAAHVREMEANLGGTEILRPLEEAFAEPRHAETRELVVLTDGEVTNTDAVLALVKRHAAVARVFSVGIGAGASAHLVKGIARAGGGAAEFIAPGERIEAKVLRLVRRVLSPCIKDVRVAWKGLNATQIPADVPPLFSGSRVVIYGLLHEGGRGTIRLRGAGPDGTLAFDMPVDLEQAAPGRVISTLAARTRIRELEESPEWLAARGSRQSRPRVSPLSMEIVQLAIRYGLVSRETSYVAVEQRDGAGAGDVQLRPIPIALTRGWGGSPHRALALERLRHYGTDAPMPLTSPQASGLDDEVFYRKSPASPSSVGGIGAAIWRRFPGRRGPGDPLRDQVLALIGHQRADGAWPLSKQVLGSLGADPSFLERRFKDALADCGVSETPDAGLAWATALACAWLELRAAELAHEWEMVAQKGRRAVQRLLPPAAVRPWLQAARDALRAS